MANEYIRKEDAIELCNNPLSEQSMRLIPPADVAPVIHSRWIKTEDGAECEKCGREAVYQIIDDHWQYEPFCPHCGAKMDGGENT